MARSGTNRKTEQPIIQRTGQGMAKSSKGDGVSKGHVTAPGARSLTISRRGIRSADDFAEMMSALMSDLMDGKVSIPIANATCNAGGKLLKVVEMQTKHGSIARKGATAKRLMLSA